MILRKPYALLIKYFKLIHVLLTLVIAFLVYRSNIILSFLNEYIRSNQTTATDNITNTIFNIWMFIFPFFIIVLSLIIISLMSVKKKPIFLYIFNIALAIAILVLYNLSYSMMTEMEAILLEARTVRLFRDFITILVGFQCVSLITSLIRATGFDIKKFNFGQDLEELDISETDNEEFEVSLEVNTNQMHRGFKRFIRFAKYSYFEHRFLIDVGILIVLASVIFIIYMNSGIYNREVKQDIIFSTTSFNLGITDSYITNQDYKGKTIDKNNKLVVLEMNVKVKGRSKEFDTAMISLEIDGKKYYHNQKYKDRLMDLGHTYQNSEIKGKFEKHLLVFKIPNEQAMKNMTFTYTDKIDYISNGINSKYIRVKITPKNLDNIEPIQNKSLAEELTLKNSVLKNTIIQIDSALIQPEFRENYNFCIDKKECYPSVEILHPNYNTSTNKAILKIVGNLELDKNITLNRVYSLAHFIYYFGTLTYEINEQKITGNVILNQIKPTKLNNKNTYYIEVPMETIDATKIWLHFHIRNKEYLYQIK